MSSLHLLLVFLWMISSNTSNAFASPQSPSSSYYGGGHGRKKRLSLLRKEDTTKTMELNQHNSIIGPVLTNVLSNSPSFWKSNGIFAASSCVGFIISVVSGSHVHLDLIGTGAFALMALPGILQRNSPTHTLLSSYAIAIWSVKLAGFLFFRAIQVGNDKRLEDLLSTTSGAFQFWFITFVWNVLSSMPYLLSLGVGKTPAELGTGGTNLFFEKWRDLVFDRSCD